MCLIQNIRTSNFSVIKFVYIKNNNDQKEELSFEKLKFVFHSTLIK